VHSAWLGVQAFPHPKLEVFATTFLNRGWAAISRFDYDPSGLPPIAGLDFALMSRAFADFSDLNVREWAQAAGVNVRLTRDLVWNAQVTYRDYRDAQPYLYDTTGRRLLFATGLTWAF
jgi:hypothetical protein